MKNGAVVKFTINLFNKVILKFLNLNFFLDLEILLKACSSVDRASDSDSESQGFDSLHAYICEKKYPFWGCLGFDI